MIYTPQSVAGPWPKTWAWRWTATKPRATSRRAKGMDPRLKPREQRLPRQLERARAARVSLQRRRNPAVSSQPLLPHRNLILSPSPLLPRRAGSFVGPEQQCWIWRLMELFSVKITKQVSTKPFTYSLAAPWVHHLRVLFALGVQPCGEPHACIPNVNIALIWGLSWGGGLPPQIQLWWVLDSCQARTMTASNAIHGWKAYMCLCWWNRVFGLVSLDALLILKQELTP